MSPDVQKEINFLHASVLSMVEFDEDIFAAGHCFDDNQYPLKKGLFCPYVSFYFFFFIRIIHVDRFSAHIKVKAENYTIFLQHEYYIDFFILCFFFQNAQKQINSCKYF
jgi:hypothetical protein